MRAVAAGLLLALGGCAAGPVVQVPRAAQAPRAEIFAAEGASGVQGKPGWAVRRHGVAAAHPLAAEAGLAMLRAGGHAIDAAVAVQAVLSLVEPQSSGIGGGAFLMHWDGRELQAWDGRETAPAAMDPRAFVRADGTPLPMAQAMVGGRAVGVPGAMAMLAATHRQHGALPWARLFEPAIALAENGFAVGQRLNALLQSNAALRQDPQARAYFYRADGNPHPVGHVLKNPALAAVLRSMARQGHMAMVRGPIADDLVARVRSSAAPGAMTLADLASYAPVQRVPLCTDWHAHWRVCGFGPPSSGHLALMQLLGLLEALPDGDAVSRSLAGPAPPAAAAVHLYVEASRLAWADRAQFVADPAFVPAPAGDWRSLLAPAYLQQRAVSIHPGQRMEKVSAGEPGGARDPALAFAPMPEQAEHGTSHVSIVDAKGNALALTTSVEAAFGARLMADGGTGLRGGYILNNQLTDFSFLPEDAQGRPVANRVEPGKRPRSSMSPTLVFDRRDGRLLMSLGSPGGPLIPHFVARTLLATLVGGQDMQRAIDGANLADPGGPVLLEKGRFPPATVQALRALGHRVLEVDLPSGLQGLQRTSDGWFGGADPRREGVVRGD
jgi:gamma-glutamyltranspeptidase/glutathione hydrolase